MVEKLLPRLTPEYVQNVYIFLVSQAFPTGLLRLSVPKKLTANTTGFKGLHGLTFNNIISKRKDWYTSAFK